jgi:hypothetical protein
MHEKKTSLSMTHEKVESLAIRAIYLSYQRSNTGGKMQWEKKYTRDEAQ